MVGVDIQLLYLQNELTRLNAAAKEATGASELISYLVVDHDHTLVGSTQSHDAQVLLEEDGAAAPPPGGHLLTMDDPGAAGRVQCVRGFGSSVTDCSFCAAPHRSVQRRHAVCV